MSRPLTVLAVVALLSVSLVGFGYAYTATFTQDLGSAEVKVSYITIIEVADSISSDGKVTFVFDKTGLTTEPLYMDLTLNVTDSTSGYLKATFDPRAGSAFYAEITGGQAKFVAIPVTASDTLIITLEGGNTARGCSVSELTIYSTGGSS